MIYTRSFICFLKVYFTLPFTDAFLSNLKIYIASSVWYWRIKFRVKIISSPTWTLNLSYKFESEYKSDRKTSTNKFWKSSLLVFAQNWSLPETCEE